MSWPSPDIRHYRDVLRRPTFDSTRNPKIGGRNDYETEPRHRPDRDDGTGGRRPDRDRAADLPKWLRLVGGGHGTGCAPAARDRRGGARDVPLPAPPPPPPPAPRRDLHP